MSDVNAAVPPRGFARVEMEQRLERARALMSESGLDALLITSEANFRYFSGLITQQWLSPTRPRYLLLPRTRAPIAIVPRSNLPGMAVTSWIEDVRDWPAPRPADDGVSLLVTAIREIAASAAIGAELGRETRLGMPVADFMRVCDEVRPIAMVDGAEVIIRTRMVKSVAEVERIRHIAHIVSDAFEALPGQVASGDTERSACRKLQLDIVRRGADRTPYIVGCSGRHGYHDANVGPTDRVLGHGDVLFIDTGSTYDGYWCDFDRHFAFGSIAGNVRRAYDLAYRATDAGIAAVKPGRRACDVWSAMARSLGSTGSPIGRMGHGLGLAVTELPSISQTDTTVLQPGYVITIEPSLVFETEKGEKKIMVHEENVVVTEQGCSLLSRRAQPEIAVVT